MTGIAGSAEPRAAAMGVRLFVARLRREPAAALAGLAVDYATFSAMCAFGVGLVVLRAPLAAAERVTGAPLRQRLIDLVARAAKA
jgi:hypothetical protein